MVIEYNNIYLKVEKPYTSKYMMVSIPFYMYRIETNEFDGKTAQIDHPFSDEIDHLFRSKLTTYFRSKLTT